MTQVTNRMQDETVERIALQHGRAGVWPLRRGDGAVLVQGLDEHGGTAGTTFRVDARGVTHVATWSDKTRAWPGGRMPREEVEA